MTPLFNLILASQEELSDEVLCSLLNINPHHYTYPWRGDGNVINRIVESIRNSPSTKTPVAHQFFAEALWRLYKHKLGLESVNQELRNYVLKHLPLHLRSAGERAKLQEVLTDFSFAMLRCSSGFIDILLKDYREARNERFLAELDVWSDAIVSNSHLLRVPPAGWTIEQVFLQIAINHADNSPLTTAAEEWKRRNIPEWTPIASVARPSEYVPSACIDVFPDNYDLQRLTECWSKWRESALEIPYKSICRRESNLTWGGKPSIEEQGESVGVHYEDEVVDRLQPPLYTNEIVEPERLPDGRIIGMSDENTLCIWDATTGQCVISFSSDNAVESYIVLPKYLLLIERKEIEIWNVRTNAREVVLSGYSDFLYEIKRCKGKYLTWHQPDRLPVLGNERTGGELRVWDDFTGECLSVLNYPAGHIDDLIFPDGRIAWLPTPNTISIYDISNNKSLTIPAKSISNECLPIILSNNRIATWSTNLAICIWDCSTGQCTQTLTGHTNAIAGMLELHDGKLASFGADRTIRLWNLQSGKCVQVMTGHSGSILEALECSPGLLASHATDGFVRLWNYES